MAKSDFGLHIPKKGKTYVYDFWVDGQRYTKSTRTARYAEALRVAAKVYAEAQGVVQRTSTPRLPDITLREAFGRYYNEKASLLKNADRIMSQMVRMTTRLGPDLFLSQLTMSDLMNYQVERRKDGVGNRTVNAEVPEIIRPLVKRARRWGVDLGELGQMTDADWSELRLQIPAHRTRAGTRAEMARLLVALRKDFRPVILFALKTGLRRSALLVRRNQIDWDNSELHYRKKSKRTNDIGWLPLTRQLVGLLQSEIKKGGPECEFVFTYVNQRTGERSPITPAGLVSQMRRAVKKAKLEDWHLFHDLRHTAATEILRASQNLAAVQEVLGHSQISQTAKYAHVLREDARQAMESRG